MEYEDIKRVEPRDKKGVEYEDIKRVEPRDIKRGEYQDIKKMKYRNIKKGCVWRHKTEAQSKDSKQKWSLQTIRSHPCHPL